MKLKIGIMGTGDRKLNKHTRQLAYEVGKEIANHNCMLVNGACYGVPYAASRGAKSANGFVLGISPAGSLKDHVEHYKFPVDVFDIIIYCGFGFKGRNVLNVTNCDAIIVIGGNAGTLNEFTIAYDEGMVIGTLEGSGSVADHVREIVRVCRKKSGAHVIYERKPKEIVSRVIKAVRKRGK
ncbi:MAG: hypothetical protein GY861_08470 [bacterium]|nr:hypothetical protein [bacterium]